jgi:hypothetical protein
MEIIQEIGSYAGFAAVLGLAVLSALYFSQARDVKRLREWAGRAPERSPVPTPAQTQRVVATPIARPTAQTPGPAVPRPPGPLPATPAASPAQAASAGAAPAVAKGPAPATPAGAGAVADDDTADDDTADDRDAEAGEDVTALDTVAHELPDAEEASAESNGNGGSEDLPETETGEQGDADDLDGEPTDDAPDENVDDAELDGDSELGDDTGEWSPEDEHSDLEFTQEHDAVTTGTTMPPRPPQPFPRRAGATAAGRQGRGAILPPYAESRPTADPRSQSSGGRKPLLIAIAGALALAVVVFGVLQVTGGDDSGTTDGGGLSATPSDSDDDAASREPIDPASVTVAVLNGTTEAGLAAQIGDQIANEGFVRGVVTNNSDQARAESVVLYAPGAEREATDVSRRLDIPQREPIDPASQTLAGDATVVVIAGADQIQ